MDRYVRVPTMECSWICRSSQHTGSKYLWTNKSLHVILIKNKIQINQNLLYCDLDILKWKNKISPKKQSQSHKLLCIILIKITCK